MFDEVYRIVSYTYRIVTYQVPNGF